MKAENDDSLKPRAVPPAAEEAPSAPPHPQPPNKDICRMLDQSRGRRRRKVNKNPLFTPDKSIKVDCKELFAVTELQEFLLRTPSVIDCEDMAQRAYRRVDALMEIMGIAGFGLKETGYPNHDKMGWVLDSLRLHVELGRLASKTLFEYCKASETRAE